MRAVEILVFSDGRGGEIALPYDVLDHAVQFIFESIRFVVGVDTVLVDPLTP